MLKKDVRIYLPLSIIIWGVVYKKLEIPEDNPILSPFAIFIGVTIGICLFFIEKIYRDFGKKDNE
ncbi:hypothetical protein ACILDT_07165 [Capnocytophaga canis]|uniref:hypothetical protein n=1 Tax=Capnocytophaga TaxID=1016 RepID=UPI000BB16E7A|nr:hypothetical protein [Capnocytophaga sp. H2931]ATA74723.1 hypothetical protein CGC52_04305 [Capnocytophaga sp. H2931]